MKFKYVCEECEAVIEITTDQKMNKDYEIDCPVCGMDAFVEEGE